MHVLIIPSWYPRHPGDINGSFFREQALALQKHGCKVGVIYPELRSLKNWKSIFSGKNGISVEQDEGLITYRSRGINWFPRTVSPYSKLSTWHGYRLFLRYIAEQGMPDIVHVHSLLYASLTAEKILEKHNIPFIATEHSTAFARDLIPQNGLLIAKKSSKKAEKRLAVSNEFAQLLNLKIGSEKSKWEEIPNIVSDIFLNKKLPNKKTENHFEFINIALMDKKKNQDNIILAFAQLCETHSKLSLTIGGNGPEKSKLEALTRELGISEKVKFPGLLTREQVLKSMAAADAFILASRYETFGVVVIEALALGKPVIATRCGGPESIVRDEDGILVPVDDVDALKNAMHYLIQNKNKYDPQEIRQSCSNRFSERAVAERLKEIYAKIISKKSQTNES